MGKMAQSGATPAAGDEPGNGRTARDDTRQAMKRTTVRDAVENVLRERILSGALAPGDRLNEVALADELGMSRGPLREAIQRLASEGLLQIVPHKGAFVTSIEEDELRHLYELRIALECYGARRACQELPLEERQAFRETLEAAADAVEREASYPMVADFHRALLALADNPILSSVARDVNARISIARNRSARQPSRAKEAYAEHVAIADALLQGDADALTSLLEAHLWHSFDSAVTVLLR